MSGDRFWLMFWGGIAITVMVIGWEIGYFVNKTSEAYINAGYTQTTLPGTGTVWWVKK
jgi:hypothetical protein